MVMRYFTGGVDLCLGFDLLTKALLKDPVSQQPAIFREPC